jgi:hypothetical protein
MNLANLLGLLEKEVSGLEFGEVVLRVQVRDGRLHRAEVSRSRSIMLETPTSCAGPTQNAPQNAETSPAMRGGLR